MNRQDEQDDRSYLTVIAFAFCIAITVIAVSLRLLARKLHKIPLGPDDYFVALGATFYVAKQLYGLAVTTIKISVLLFYRRLFTTPQFRKQTNVVGALVVAWLLTNNLLAAFQCTPVRKAWQINLLGQCVNPLTSLIAIQVPNVVLNMVILALPISMLLDATGKCSWTVIEPAIEVLSACLPTMAPFLNRPTHLANFRSTLRSMISPNKSSRSEQLRTSASKHQFRDVDNFNKTCTHDSLSDHTGKVAAIPPSQPVASDQIPLNSIVVTQDFAWSEESR
ncbi:MAG: hypothetical protein Q9187_003824 [Circinaria calcarea]